MDSNNRPAAEFASTAEAPAVFGSAGLDGDFLKPESQLLSSISSEYGGQRELF